MRGGSWDTMSSTCVQSGMHALGGGGYIMEARSPATATHWHLAHHNITAATNLKQEPVDTDSSAYGSGSDGFHSSSPGGSDHHSRDSDQQSMFVNHDSINMGYYSTPIPNRIPVPTATPLQHSGFNPLTPPSFEPMISPNIQPTVSHTPDVKMENPEILGFSEDTNTTLTPCNTPPSEETPPKSPKHGEENEYYKEDEDHLRRLQMAFEKNDMLSASMTTPTSPKGSDSNRDSGEDDGKSDYDIDEMDENGIRVPRVNSHGKVKTFKCKQCDFVAVTKLDFWEHSRAHIKAEKLLTCPKCPFITEYKHHLEYHLRNHFGSKPFKCDKCSYSCVNKSMLNSHLKSHSNVYQYRCADCTYATKYCHSLKLHLRKYKHSPAMVLNQDGTPNPLPIIDVYGTRRGPKQKLQHQQDQTLEEPVKMPSPPHNPLPPVFNPFVVPNSQPPVQLPFPWLGALPFPGALPNPFLFPQLQEQLSPTNSVERPENEGDDKMDVKEKSPSPVPASNEGNALDLRKPEITLPINIPEVNIHTPLAVPLVNKNRRKGRAFKLERMQVNQESSTDEEEEKKVEEKEVKVIETPKKDIHNCQYCDIAFRDIVMYTMHMGYHGFKDPFTCNMCGEQSGDKVAFFLHIARTSHS